MWLRHIHKFLVIGVLLVGLPAPLYACGPFFPHRILMEDEKSFLELPYSTFAYEAQRVPAPEIPQFKPVVPPMIPGDNGWHGYAKARQTEQMDLEELGKALTKIPIDPDKRQQVVGSYSNVRQILTKHNEALVAWKEQQLWEETPIPEPPFEADVKVPEHLPGEFADYLRGAIAYHRKEFEAARLAWSTLLARPADERHFRSTWAAFMTGRSLMEADPNEACKWFQKVRDLAGAGYADSLGLASATLGWEARAELKQEHFIKAFELYRVQLEAGEPSAMNSLLFTARRAFKEGSVAARTACARNETARRLLTAYLLSASSFAGDPKVLAWLENFKGIETPTEEAERLAWAAYQSGRIEMSRAWLEKAPKTATIAQWLRAKLLLRDGKIKEALPLISEVVARFPRNDHFTISRDTVEDQEVFDSLRAMAEIGTLSLARNDYIAALDSLVQSSEFSEYGDVRHWQDAAYVAEQVLFLEELKAFVDARWPQSSQSTPDEKKLSPGERMRYLLSRRLAREGRLQEAIPYCPVMWRASMEGYAQGLQLGRDETIPGAKRAEALWQTAQLAKSQGLELLGTEVDPDWLDLAGEYDLGSMAKDRPRAGVIKANGEELKRSARNRPKPDKRFHYRYVAADLGWEASRLMPDNTDETALVLTISGTWLKNIDSKAADRFYKALVQRCDKTELGKKARETRWFPPLSEGSHP